LEKSITPYELIGGEPAVKKLVHRFYELMEELPEAYAVRQLHPESLAGSEEMLFEYLSGWLALLSQARCCSGAAPSRNAA